MPVKDPEDMTDEELLKRVAAIDCEESDLPEIAQQTLDEHY